MNKVVITDSKKPTSAAVATVDGVHGLVVNTRDAVTYDNAPGLFINPDNGVAMNVDASTGGTPDNVNNGGDNVYWTASSITGTKFTFNSTDRAHSGTRSIKVDNPALNDVFQVAKGSDINLNNYASMTLWINVDKDWDASDSVEMYAFDTAGGTEIGDRVPLENYFSFNVFDTWHLLSIPLTDFGAAATSTIVDAFRVQQTARSGKAGKWYLDDWAVQETGTPVEYFCRPNKGKKLILNAIQLTFAKAITGTLADATMPAIAYDSFLGATLTAGLTYKRANTIETFAAATVNDPMDIIQIPGASYISGSDGTNTWVSYTSTFGEPLVLDSNIGDYISYTISEDLSGFLFLRAGYSGKEV